jgi:hypothetical protein
MSILDHTGDHAGARQPEQSPTMTPEARFTPALSMLVIGELSLFLWVVLISIVMLLWSRL